MSVRAGIVVTGTEVLTGRIADRNGPWVSEQLLGMGVDVAHITICGDRPADLIAQLRFLAAEHVDLIITTGGLGPTADDLTVATIAEVTARELSLDPDLEAHIAAIIQRWRGATVDVGTEHIRAGIRKQALVPAGATPIPPTGTAPGMAVPTTGDWPSILVLPGPPRELQSMWSSAMMAPAVATALAGREQLRQETIRAYGMVESELAETLRAAEQQVPGFSALEVTTCLRGGEVDMVTRFDDAAASTYTELTALLDAHHGRHIFSTDGSTVDDLLAAALRGRRIATAESCTGGLIAARLTDRPGSSDYVMGGVVSYSDEVKQSVLDVPSDLLAANGAVSEPVAAAMADGVMRHLAADVAVSTTGIAGPGGGSELKPVGTVCFGLALAGRPTYTMTRRFPGDRAMVRSLSVTAAMHLLLRALDPADVLS